MKTYVFIDIDTQIDFIHDLGNLAVPGAGALRDNLKALTDFALANKIKIVASTDAHPPDDSEFEIFPSHCVVGTDGQLKIEETTVENNSVIKNEAEAADLVGHVSGYDQVLLEKQTFDVFTNLHAEAVIDSLQAEEYVVYGVATDYCVKAAVLGLLERGCEVTVVEDAIAPVEEQTGEESLTLMREEGAIFKSTVEIIGS